MKNLLIAVGICLIYFQGIHAQEVYQHISSTEIYAFLDEMANEGYIELNSAIKPYSRMFIAKKLEEVNDKIQELNQRQQQELLFYLKDFNKELLPDKNFPKRFDIFYYKDSLFTFSLNPVLGLQYWTNENGTNYHRRNGGEVFASIPGGTGGRYFFRRTS